MNTGCCKTCWLLGRILVSAIFLMSGVHKITAWDQTAEQMTNQGMFLVPLFLVGAIVLEVGGGLSLLLGWWARVGAAMLIVFLIPTTLIFHDFWTFEGQEQQMQMSHFLKNLAIMGGLMFILRCGAGPWSIDGESSGKPSEPDRVENR